MDEGLPAIEYEPSPDSLAPARRPTSPATRRWGVAIVAVAAITVATVAVAWPGHEEPKSLFTPTWLPDGFHLVSAVRAAPGETLAAPWLDHEVVFVATEQPERAVAVSWLGHDESSFGLNRESSIDAGGGIRMRPGTADGGGNVVAMRSERLAGRLRSATMRPSDLALLARRFLDRGEVFTPDGFRRVEVDQASALIEITAFSPSAGTSIQLNVYRRALDGGALAAAYPAVDTPVTVGSQPGVQSDGVVTWSLAGDLTARLEAPALDAATMLRVAQGVEAVSERRWERAVADAGVDGGIVRRRPVASGSVDGHRWTLLEQSVGDGPWCPIVGIAGVGGGGFPTVCADGTVTITFSLAIAVAPGDVTAAAVRGTAPYGYRDVTATIYPAPSGHRIALAQLPSNFPDDVALVRRG